VAQEVAFLFADVEGSTRLVQRLGDAWADALAQLRSVLRAAVVAEGGSEVDARGDEVFAVFPHSAAAARAAIAAQRQLLQSRWPGDEVVRVRMGVHHGAASADEAVGFVGLEVHRASRICSAGHGGQVLVSEPAAALVDANLRNLGLFALDGLSTPERIFQLLEPDLPSEFPPLRAARRRDIRPLRVVLADDSVLLREGIARLLEDAGMEVVAQSGDAEGLLREVELHRPDTAIVDIRMPPTFTDDGLRAAAEIRRRFPEVGVMVLSSHLELEYAAELLRGGAAGIGYLLKDRVADVDDFAAAVRRVAADGAALDRNVVAELVDRPRRPAELDTLAREERELLELVAEGRSNEAIAQRLFETVPTAEARVAGLFAKLGLPLEPTADARVLTLLDYLQR
jgi:DNA-binding NarL/FixJ family response regulator/class 3 adenylate cyclase